MVSVVVLRHTVEQRVSPEALRLICPNTVRELFASPCLQRPRPRAGAGDGFGTALSSSGYLRRIIGRQISG